MIPTKSIVVLALLALHFTANAQTGELKNLRDSWVQYLQTKQLDKSMDLYTDDAIFFEPDGKRAAGKAELRDLFSTVMKTFNSEIHLKSVASGTSGSLSYDSGDFDEVLVAAATGAKINSRFSVSRICKRNGSSRSSSPSPALAQSSP